MEKHLLGVHIIIKKFSMIKKFRKFWSLRLLGASQTNEEFGLVGGMVFG
jgi:hypothetical protein